MKTHLVIASVATLLLSGCETLQSPQQRRQTTARQQAAVRHADERLLRLQSQVESIEMENARLMQQMQELQNELRTFSAQLGQIDGAMRTLDAKQAREMNELISRVESLLKKSVAARPTTSRPTRGSGYEHIVESGHTLSAIAASYGTTVKAIKQANNLSSDNIYVGQKLFIPE